MNNNIVDRSSPVRMDYSYTEPSKPRYQMTDLSSVYSHWSPELNRNIVTENKLNGGIDKNGKSGK
jgi:hypothetical protein